MLARPGQLWAPAAWAAEMEVSGHGEHQHRDDPDADEGLASTGPWRLQWMLGRPAFVPGSGQGELCPSGFIFPR